jgi:prevent-host-death family protein
VRTSRWNSFQAAIRRIAKADGDAPVQAYIAAMPGWKRDIGRWLDALIVRNVPNVRKAVKWNSPFYGIEGQGWFLGIHTFAHYVKVAFFRGTSLRPVPPTMRRYCSHVNVGVRSLKEHLSEYLERAARGETIVVTDRGEPKAMLGPVPGRLDLERGIAEKWIRGGSGEPPRPVRRFKPRLPTAGAG